jgi:hypothetical protein
VDGPERAHAHLADHALGEGDGALDVVGGARGHRAEDDLLGGAPSEEHRDAILEVFAPVHETVAIGDRLRDAERPAARQDRHFVDRVAVLGREPDGDVPRLVNGRRVPLVFFHDQRLALVAHGDAIARELDVVVTDRVGAVARGEDGRLVEQACQIGARAARRRARHGAELDFASERDLLGVDAEDLFPAPHVGMRDGDLPVEAPRPKQRRVEDVGAVGRRENDDSRGLVESIHLDEQLVQHLVGVGGRGVLGSPSPLSERVDLVDEHDARRHAAGLGEEAAHARRADAGEHLLEARAARGKERNARLVGGGAREERLAGARRPRQKDAAGRSPAEPPELHGIAQEFDRLFETLLGFVDARDVGERSGIRRVDAVHVPHVRQPLLAVDGETGAHERQEEDGREEGVDRPFTDRVVRQELDRHVALGEERDHGVLRVSVGDDGRRRRAVLQLEEHAIAVDFGLLHVARGAVRHELRVADALDAPVRRGRSPNRPADADDAEEGYDRDGDAMAQKKA